MFGQGEGVRMTDNSWERAGECVIKMGRGGDKERREQEEGTPSQRRTSGSSSRSE